MLVPHPGKDPPGGQNVLDHEQLSILEHPIPVAFPGICLHSGLSQILLHFFIIIIIFFQHEKKSSALKYIYYLHVYFSIKTIKIQ